MASATAVTAAFALLTAPVTAEAASIIHNPTGHLDSAKGVGIKHALQRAGQMTRTPAPHR